MSKSSNYVPRNDNEFLKWIKNIVDYVMLYFERFRIYQPTNEFIEMINDFENKLRIMDDLNHGSVDTRDKNEAREKLEKEARAFVQGYLTKNPMVTNTDKERMALPIYDTKPSSVTDPTGQAEAVVSYPGKTQLNLHIKHIDGTPLEVKSAYGYRIYYRTFAPAEAPPVSGKDLYSSRFTRQKKMLFTFEPEDSGKSAYFAIRYENSKGHSGPWGPLFSAIIP